MIEVHSAELLPLHQEVLRPRYEVPGIEVCSTESVSEVPWIEVHSTEMFNLNWGDAQTWLNCKYIAIVCA